MKTITKTPFVRKARMPSEAELLAIGLWRKALRTEVLIPVESAEIVAPQRQFLYRIREQVQRGKFILPAEFTFNQDELELLKCLSIFLNKSQDGLVITLPAFQTGLKKRMLQALIASGNPDALGREMSPEGKAVTDIINRGGYAARSIKAPVPVNPDDEGLIAALDSLSKQEVEMVAGVTTAPISEIAMAPETFDEMKRNIDSMTVITEKYLK